MDEKHFESLYPENTRFAEIEKILGYIKEGNFCQIVGVPGIGKGALLRCLTYNRALRTKHLGENQKWLHFVLIDCKEARNKPVTDVIKLIFACLLHSVEQRGMVEEHARIQSWLEDSLKLGDDLLLRQNLKKTVEYLSLEKELTIVLLLERFHTLTPRLTSEFFSFLSGLKDRTSYRFSVVFSVNRPLEQMIEQSMYEDVYPLIAGHTVFLALKDEPTLTFRLAYLQKTLQKQLSDAMKQEIIRYTGGLLKMTLTCAEEVLNSSLSSWPASPRGELVQDRSLEDSGVVPLSGTPQNDEKAGLWEFFLESKAVRNVSYEIWNALSPQEQSYLKKLSLASSRHPELVSGSSEMLKHLACRQAGVQHDKNIHEFLENVRIVEKNKFTIPLFEAFVQYRAEHLSDEKIAYNPETKDIAKGDTILTGKLTRSEFRLLKHCLEHPDRIMDRGELVSTVWSEAKSTAGVTDQAIDQLVFRLRRKIEDDPNAPKYLLTVKGRGVRFIP